MMRGNLSKILHKENHVTAKLKVVSSLAISCQNGGILEILKKDISPAES